MPASSRYLADVSNNNGHVDMRAYRKAGHRAIAIKATEGIGGRQHIYPQRVQAAHAAGLKVIHYHFAHPDHHPTSLSEACEFLAVIKPHFKRGDRLALDLEIQPMIGLNLARYARDFAAACRDAGYGHGWLYSYTSYLRQHGTKLIPNGWRLWLADYSPPVGGKRAGIGTPWVHQYTNGRDGPKPHNVIGIGNCDVSLMSRRAALGLHLPR